LSVIINLLHGSSAHVSTKLNVLRMLANGMTERMLGIVADFDMVC
jgi:hypothetical protein